VANALAARRYAQAVFEIAQEANQIDQWLSDLEIVSETLQEPRVQRFFENPDIPFKKKQAVLADSLHTINPLALNLLYVLTQRGRIKLLGDITKEYRAMVNDLRGVEFADVITAIPLDKAQTERITQQLETMTGKKITLRQQVDPAIVGGLVTRVGDKMIDGSLKTRLESLKLHLK
jgi:F-type H+-transporting ATPase subunit delta